MELQVMLVQPDWTSQCSELNHVVLLVVLKDESSLGGAKVLLHCI